MVATDTRTVTSGKRGPAPECPEHATGAMRWTYNPAVDDWERCEVVDVYGEFGGRFGDYPELYDVRLPNGKISRGHFAHSLRDQRPSYGD